MTMRATGAHIQVGLEWFLLITPTVDLMVFLTV